MKQSRVVAAVIGWALIFGAGGSRAALVIDGFDSGEAFEIENIGFGASISQPADVLGGSRQITVSTRAEFDPLVGLDLITTSIASNARLSILYQGNGADIASGANRFELTFESAGAPISLSSSITAQVILAYTAYPAGGTALGGYGPTIGTVSIPFIHPIQPDVVSVLLEVMISNGYPGDAVRLTSFRAVPEPAVAATLACALLLGAAARRSR